LSFSNWLTIYIYVIHSGFIGNDDSIIYIANSTVVLLLFIFA